MEIVEQKRGNIEQSAERRIKHENRIPDGEVVSSDAPISSCVFDVYVVIHDFFERRELTDVYDIAKNDGRVYDGNRVPRVWEITRERRDFCGHDDGVRRGDSRNERYGVQFVRLFYGRFE